MRTFLVITILFLLNACGIDDDVLRVQSFSFCAAASTVKDTAEFEVQDNGFLKIYRSHVVFYAGLDSLDISLSAHDNTILISEIPFYTPGPSNSYCCNYLEDYSFAYTIGPLARKTYFIIIGNQPGLLVNIPFSPTKFRK